MVDRSIIAPMEQMRSFDFISFEHDVLLGMGVLAQDMLSQLPKTVVAGFVATQTGSPSLSINLGAGRIYQFAQADATSVGSIPADPASIVQQGQAAAQSLTFIPPAAGQSQWNLIQAQFSQLDAVRANDPNNGIVPFYNVSNPTQPTNQNINTVRQAVCVIQVITGAPATTGSEVPPTPSTGWVPLYLIDLTGGQTQITTSQILTAGPSVGTGVPANYPTAPFLAGFLASHHSGGPGQAPKVNLATEVQGVLPYINMSPVRTLLNANLNLYVNASTGADTNSGLSPSTPFKTIQRAVSATFQNYDFNGFHPIINLAAGTYTSTAVVSGNPIGIGAGAFVNIVGNTASPSTVIISTSLPCFTAALGASLSVAGVTVASSGTPVGFNAAGVGLYSWGGSLLSFNNVNFGACGYAHQFAQQGGAIVLNIGISPNYTINGAAPAHMLADAFALVSCNSGAVTITGTPNFSSAFAVSTRCSIVQATTASYSGAATGARYLVNQNAVITTNSGGNATFFPGSTAGSAATGGQYS